MREYVLGRIDDLPDRKGTAFQVGNRTVAVFRIDRRVYAINNRCIHKGASMCEGDVSCADRLIVRCPWHNWPWDLETGQHCLDPAERLRTYDVKIEGDQVILCV